MPDRVLLDTNALIAGAGGNAEVAISVMTIAELRIGVLRARDATQRSLRLGRLEQVEQTIEALPVDRAVAVEYSRLVAILRDHGRTVRPIDTLIAATARAAELPVVTSDRDFAPLADLAGIAVRWE